MCAKSASVVLFEMVTITEISSEGVFTSADRSFSSTCSTAPSLIFCVASNRKVQRNFVFQYYENPPDQIPNHKLVLILARENIRM